MTLTYPERQPLVDLTLASGAVLDVRPPVVLGVRRGRLWVTQTGDPADHVLGPGDTFASQGAGLLVVQALEQTVLSAH